MVDNPFFNRLSGFAAQPVTRQIALLIGMAASVAMGIGAIQWATTPDYEPVFGPMSPVDNVTAISTLEANGIPYRVENGSGLLSVPYEQVPQARITLASEGFPLGAGVGFESLYEQQEMGLSSFMEQARYHRAVEAELGRTISSMNSVKGARVHLAIAKQSAFIRKGQGPSASVMVSLYPGRGLSDRQLSGVVHLVASSVPDLDASNVSVVDQAGKLLSDQGEDPDFGYTAEQFRIRQQIENSLNGRVMAILEPILGTDAIRAQVTADMDFTRIERTSEQFDPQTVVRSEQSSEDVSNIANGIEAGIPGLLIDQPPGPAQTVGTLPDTAAVTPPSPARESRKLSRNFELNRHISHIREVPGNVNKLSVAVVVDYTTDENGEKVPLEQTRIDEITQLVREAVGFDQARGDSVSVINSPFVAPAPLEEIPEPGLLEQNWIWRAARLGLSGAALFALLLLVVRPLIRYSTSYVSPVLSAPEDTSPPRLEGPSDGSDGLSDDHVALSGLGPEALPGPDDADYHRSIAMARSVANEQPARAAYVVRNWMTADG